MDYRQASYGQSNCGVALMARYDFLVAGAGLFGCTFAHVAARRGKRCLVLERRPHLGGNAWCQELEGIQVHAYGAHIFHTNSRKVWDFVNSFAEFNGYINSPLAIYKGQVYNLPFNMNTFNRLWGVVTPAQAREKIASQVAELDIGEPRNLEEQALKLVGPDIYERFIRGYTEKQWGRKATELPAFIIRRLPVRFTYDNNYFSARYQGIPLGGYNRIVDGLLEGIEARTGEDVLAMGNWRTVADALVFSGMIDSYFGCCEGPLAYRSLRFEHQLLDVANYQGNAVINYTEAEVPYTRIVEHKHFEFGSQPKTVITHEYPQTWTPGEEPYYPVNDPENEARLARYKTLASQEKGVFFGGRLGTYSYVDMDKVIASAWNLAERIC